jgi:hypothetical protein
MVQYSDTRTVIVDRPTRLYSDVEGEHDNRQVWYNGKTLTILDKSRNIYTTLELSGSLETMCDTLFKDYGLALPLADLVYRKSYEVLTGNVKSGKYMGKHVVGDRVCHHLAFHQDAVDWQIWVDAGRQAVPRKVVIRYLKAPGQPEYVATLDDWDFSPEFTADRFEPSFPVGAHRVDMKEFLRTE